MKTYTRGKNINKTVCCYANKMKNKLNKNLSQQIKFIKTVCGFAAAHHTKYGKMHSTFFKANINPASLDMIRKGVGFSLKGENWIFQSDA